MFALGEVVSFVGLVVVKGILSGGIWATEAPVSALEDRYHPLQPSFNLQSGTSVDKPKEISLQNLRQLRTHRITRPPHLRLLSSIVFIILNKIPQMVLQRLIIRLLLPLQNLHDDRREAVAVEVHFLVVGDLADVAVKR